MTSLNRLKRKTYCPLVWRRRTRFYETFEFLHCMFMSPWLQWHDTITPPPHAVVNYLSNRLEAKELVFLFFCLMFLHLCHTSVFKIACVAAIQAFGFYLIPWTLGWSHSRPFCSSPGSPPWPWCRRRDSCILGIGPSTGTSSRCCGRATRPRSYTPRSWVRPPQNAHAGTLAGHLASLEKNKLMKRNTWWGFQFGYVAFSQAGMHLDSGDVSAASKKTQQHVSLTPEVFTIKRQILLLSVHLFIYEVALQTCTRGNSHHEKLG